MRKLVHSVNHFNMFFSDRIFSLAGTAENGNAFSMLSDDNTASVPAENPACPPARTLAFLVLRLWIGASALASGLAKFARSEKIFEENPETGEMTASIARNYDFDSYVGVPAREFEKLLGDALLPEWLLHVFYYAIGPALILFGSGVLLGIATRTSLFALGMIFAALTLGLSLIDPSGSAGTLGIYTLAIAGALLLSDANRFCIWRKF